MKKTRFKTLALGAFIALFLCLAFVFARPLMVSAEETEPPTQETVEQTENGEDGGFAALFNEVILPLIIAAGGTGVGYFAILLPFLRRINKLKRKIAETEANYERAHGRFEVIDRENEKLRAAAGQVDYSNIIKELVEGAVGEKLRLYDTTLAEMGVNLKALVEQFAAFRNAAQIVWGEKIPAAAEALAALPPVRLLKKYELENALLKDKIAEFKGDEADKTIAGVTAAVEARV